MKKYFITILFFIIAANIFSQHKIITKYYDSLWIYTTIEKAKFSITYEDKDSVYDCVAYYVPSNKMYSRFLAIDTFPSSFINLKLGYYESGKIKDSSFNTINKNQYSNDITTRGVFQYMYYESGKLKEAIIYKKGLFDFDRWVYYENGRVWAHIYSDKKGDNDFSIVNEVFDSVGNLIPNYIYQMPASFPGGVKGWQNYLIRNLNSDIPVMNGAPSGKYTVVVDFIIDKDGRVSNVVAENNPGYGTMQEAVRVIKNGPNWEPAIQKNEKVLCRHRQSITFAISNGR